MEKIQLTQNEVKVRTTASTTEISMGRSEGGFHGNPRKQAIITESTQPPKDGSPF